MSPDSGADTPRRSCGDCTLCCTVLRVDEIGKLGGEDCVHQQAHGGCAIYSTRPNVCRGYRCLWLSGGLGDADRPDRLGAVLDLLHPGIDQTLRIREAEPGAFDGSPRLQEIAAHYRASMPVRITDTGDVLDPERPYRVLLPDGDEQRVSGDRIEIFRDGHCVEERRLPWPERSVRRMVLLVQRRILRRFAARASRFRSRTGAGS